MKQGARDWQELTKRLGEEEFLVERVRLPDSDLVIEGSFEPPPLARLPAEDQVFVAAFVKSHGSIKAMERLFGVSYPTVKNRLNRISARLDFVDVVPESDRTGILDDLDAGRIDAAEAARRLREASGGNEREGEERP